MDEKVLSQLIERLAQAGVDENTAMNITFRVRHVEDARLLLSWTDQYPKATVHAISARTKVIANASKVRRRNQPQKEAESLCQDEFIKHLMAVKLSDEKLPDMRDRMQREYEKSDN